MSIKAIETIYKGFRFRSRLEARWAVFFDKLGIEWEYESQGFELADGTRYLPDFFIYTSSYKNYKPGSGYWVEIKGPVATKTEIEKMQKICINTDRSGYIFSGAPYPDNYVHCHHSGHISIRPNPRDDEFYKSAFFKAFCFETMPIWANCGVNVVGDDYVTVLEKSALAARQARFEHHRSDRYALN